MRYLKLRLASLLVCVAGLLLLSSQVYAAGQTMAAWGENIPGAVGYDLYFSSVKNGEWSTPEIISDSPKPDILPALTANSIDDIWLVWTQLDDVRGILKFRRRVNGNWSTVETFSTGLKTNMAPTVIVDGKGEVWLAWSGVMDQDDDIYFSRWQGRKWAEPSLVHPDNNVPDILPQLSLSSSGKPLLTWMSYDGKRYQNSLSEWNGRKWTTLTKKSDLFSKSMAQSNKLHIAVVPHVPVFIRDTSQTSIMIEGSAGSIRLKEQD